MKWAFASVPAIIRAGQKDQHYQWEMEGRIRNLLSLLFGPKWFQWIGVEYGGSSSSSPTLLTTGMLARILYLLFTTGHGVKTLGEEYSRLLLVDLRRQDVPVLWKRLAYIVFSQMDWPGLLLLLIKRSSKLQPALQKKISRLVRLIEGLVLPLHQIWFYRKGGPEEISKRILGLDYVHERSPKHLSFGY